MAGSAGEDARGRRTAGAKSQTDLYWMSEFRGYAYHELKQPAEAARELESALNNPCMPEAKKAERYRSLVGLYSSLRNYPKAIDFGNRALKISRDPETQVAVAQAYYQSGNNKDAARVMNELLASLRRRARSEGTAAVAGAEPPARRPATTPASPRCSKNSCSNYPKPDYWSQLLTSLRKLDTDDIQKLNVMRLSTQVNVMKKPEEYKEMAQLALEDKLAGEAQSVLEQGFTKKIFVDERDVSVNTRLLAAAKKEAETDKAAMASVRRMRVRRLPVMLPSRSALSISGYGDAVKAAELLQKGIAKGGIAKGDPKEKQRIDEACILLGIAHLRNNNKAEAAKAFREREAGSDHGAHRQALAAEHLKIPPGE